jgi:DNA polymerase type B, organellar and viral
VNKIAVLDLETDPFEFNKMIYPFVGGFYDGTTFTSYWSQDCVERLVKMLNDYPEPLTIYAHNGGRFDYFYFLPWIRRDLRIVNSRIIQAWLGKHELRDSYAIMPFALEEYKKTPIDYNTFKPGVREKHRQTIISYLRDDCMDLYTLCVEFEKEFGNSLTIGVASMKQLRKFHTFESGNAQYDAKFRTNFYYGGRNQVFKSGIIQGPIKVYDVNSMYPHVMQSCLHPVSIGISLRQTITNDTAFISVRGKNYGAFPVRSEDNSLDFTQTSGTFHTTIHEYQAAIETRTFIPDKIILTYNFKRREPFDEFVSHFYDARKTAKKNGDKIRTIFYKFVMNSAYGKFAQNPENYADWYITEAGEFPPDYHQCSKSCDPERCKKRWTPSYMCDNYIIWERPLFEQNYYNIATGASITGAARATLLKGLKHANSPYYVDTDSIICRSLDGLNLDETTLGAWKLEATGTSAAICGKKLYAIYGSPKSVCICGCNPSCGAIKKAHKGARLDGHQILHIARGATIESCNPVPRFKFDGSHSFTKRNITRTGSV